MKNFFIFFIFFNLIFSCKNSGKQMISKTGDQNVFIVHDKDSKYYERRRNFSFNEFDWQTFKNSYKNLKDLNSFNLNEFPKNWVQLFQYKGDFYTYLPCDFCSDYTLQFSNDLIIEKTCEGPNAYGLKEFKQINSNDYSIKFSNRRLIVHLVDVKKGVAVFEEEGKYSLMINAKTIENFPIIENECLNSKGTELEFETPDFKRLLNQK